MKSKSNEGHFAKSVLWVGLGLIILTLSLIAWSKAPAAAEPPREGFYFVQLSDTHWGFNNPDINPDYKGTLKKAIAGVNALPKKPDFLVFTGDLTHTTDDDQVRRTRMAEFKEIIKGLQVQDIKFLPGEHDASLDNGAAFKAYFGPTHYTFEHQGVHFIALDNVSDPHGNLGDEQLQWLGAELKRLDKNARIIILTHRPLFDLAADWDWTTADGEKALELLKPYKNVTVLYGHIHQLNNHATGVIDHLAAMGLMYPLPVPHAVPKKAPIPWNPARPYFGLGYRLVQITPDSAKPLVTEFPFFAGPVTSNEAEQVIKITAWKFEYSPKEITLKKGVPVILELTALDRQHGFNCPELKIRADVNPGETTRLRIVPDKVGQFEFHCDIFCGTGHEQMTGMITVTE